MIFVLAIIGALTVFAFAIVALALLLAWLSPSDEPVTVRPPEPLMVPLVPAATRKQHADIWVN